MFKTAPFKNRENLAALLNSMQLLGEAVEIGTHRGDYAATFLKEWQGKKLHCVDPWRAVPGYEVQAEMLVDIMQSDGNREHDYEAAVRNTSPYSARVEFIKKTSEDAAPLFEDNSLDFVYLDGDHQYEPVKKDLSLWWPKVRSGGVLAGHDIVCPGEIGGGWGMYIKPAVEEHMIAYSLDVFVIVEVKSLPYSYYMVKP